MSVAARAAATGLKAAGGLAGRVDARTAAEDAQAAFLGAVAAGDPTKIVRDAVREGRLDDWFEDRERPKPIHVLALGKAAPRMVWGLVEGNVPFSGFGAAPKGVPFPLVDTMSWHAGEHPVPGDGSFAAGEALLAWVDRLPDDAPVIVLLSGGASSAVEAGDRDAILADWMADLRAGLPIEELNRRRHKHSELKGGGLGRLLKRRTDRIRVWAMSDVPPEHPEAIGGGPVGPDVAQVEVLADASLVQEAAAQTLIGLGHTVYGHAERIAGDATSAVDRFLAAWQGLPAGDAALVGSGEPTVATPIDAPPGGRAQHSALLAARWMKEHGADGVFMAAGTDGVDGTTREAGAWATAGDFDDAARQALTAFDAHRVLSERGLCIRSGATGTNLNDVWIAVRTS